MTGSRPRVELTAVPIRVYSLPRTTPKSVASTRRTHSIVHAPFRLRG